MMKLKLDENGNVVVQDGKPVYIHDDGKEIAFDALQATKKIAELNSEAKQHREAKEAVEAKLKAFDGVDADKARNALETIRNLDDKKLIDIGEVEKVKAEAKKTFDEQLAKVMGEKDDILRQYHHSVISGEFARSSLIKDKTILPPEIAQSFFGGHFSVDEGGKLVATQSDGKPIYSRINAGELASFDEALEIIINNYAHKDNILRGSQASGAGGVQSSTPNTNLSFSECKTEADKVAWLKARG